MTAPLRAGSVLLLTATLCALPACSSRPRIDTSIAQERARRIQQSMELTERADRAAERGQDAKALELYQSAITAYPDLAPAWNNMGNLLMRNQNYVDAVDAFQTAADLNTSDPRPITNIGLAYHEAGFDSKAINYFEQALDRDPRCLDAIRGATRANMRLRKFDAAALRNIENGLLVDPDPAWREVYQRERFRIENAQRLAERGVESEFQSE